MNAERTVVLSLISHTNIGKTTLTRTLLRRDVGEVRDEAHVTLESARYPLIEHEGDALLIWDTPGFGPVGKLLKRLAQEGGTLGWIMHEVVDRAFNRSLYSSVEAARNVRAEADVVLYLVNARERPEDAGYVSQELTLLEALGKPVLMVLNQVASATAASSLEHLTAWRKHFRTFACLKEVLLLDAFTRSWLQELQLFDLVAPHLEEVKRPVLRRLRDHFVKTQRAIFEDCIHNAGQAFWYAANQRLNSDGETDHKEIFAAMVAQLQSRLDDYLDLLVRRHNIQAEGQAQLKVDVAQVTGLVKSHLEETKTGLLTGAIASAGTGLMADIMAGGLTLGGGVLLGFLGGYLGGMSYAKLLNLIGRGGPVTWKAASLVGFFRLLVDYYLLAALHGRGKGKLEVDQPVPFIKAAVDKTTPSYQDQIEALVRARENQAAPDADWHARFAAVFRDLVTSVLAEIYPQTPPQGPNRQGDDPPRGSD